MKGGYYEKITVFGLMLISALAIDNPMANILKDYENKCNAGDEMAYGVAGGVYDFAFEAYGVKQDYGKAMRAAIRETTDRAIIWALCMTTKRA